MSESMRELLRDENYFVLLLPNCDEQFLTREELKEFLQRLLQEYPDLISSDLERYSTDQAQRLMDTTCVLELNPGETIQWYAVRLKK